MHIAFSLRRRRFLIIAPKAPEIFKMQITEILQRTSEMQGKNAVLLLHEGLFWRAYEQGALALCEYVHPFKVTTRYYKGIGQWVSYVGFPDSSLRKWTVRIPVDTRSPIPLLSVQSVSELQCPIRWCPVLHG